MDTELRERIDHSKFYQGAIRELAALLPPTDEALGALIAETVAAGDPYGFVMLTTAALDAGRRVGAEHLIGGAELAGDLGRLGNLAWKMEGDVPAALMAAMKGPALVLEMHAAALFLVAAWCAERRGGELPPGFGAEARHLARNKGLRPEALLYLAAAATVAKDGDFLAVLRQNHPRALGENLTANREKFISASLAVNAGPVMVLVPEEPAKTLARGSPMQRAVEKHGRNDQCHCGSGKKYKRCCFDKDQERLHFSTGVAGRTRAELRAEPETGLTEPRLNVMQPFELAQLDPRKIPVNLQGSYILRATSLRVLEHAVEFFEVLDWNDERRDEWNFVLFFIMRQQRKDLAARMVAVHERHEPVPDLRDGVRLLLARDDPAAELQILTETAAAILRETDAETLDTLAHGVLCSRHSELGILVCRSLIPLLPRKEASFLLGEILETRDRLNLSPDDPFGDVLEKRLTEETHDEGGDAAKLRAVRRRLDAKAAEVRDLTEKIARQRHELERREKGRKTAAQPPATGANPPQADPGANPGPPPANPAVADDPALREMRFDLARLKATLGERAAERTALRGELEKARDELDTLRGSHPAPAPAGRSADDDEAAHYLPEQPAGNQPLRLIEFPHKFRETLGELPRHAARAALAMIGRLAGGEPAAFAGVVQLKACHGILRQRIGSEYRLLFSLLPDRVQIVDLINRRDLDRKIKTLRATA